MQSPATYFQQLSAALGSGWNRFWFTPTQATTLGILRIATGLLALYAVATYAPDLHLWFASDGMLPITIIRDLYDGQWSVLDYASDQMLWPAYGIALAVIALFTVGVGGRVAAVAAAVATLSFFARGRLVTGVFEAILAFLLVYLCVGRAGDAFSLSALFKRRKGAGDATLAPSVANIQHPASSIQYRASSIPSPLNTISLRLIQIHVVLVHLMIGLAQVSAPESAWWSGEGIWLAAARPGMSLVDLRGLEEHPRIVAAWSHTMTIYLLAMPVFVWIRVARPLVLLLGVFVWLSFAVASGWTPFCLAMVTGLAAFVAPPSSRPATP